MAGRDNAGPSNRRQPVRQTRTNPQRTATNIQMTGSSTVQPQEESEPATPGLFPALTHFTDAIAALPKEMTRHYTMLKEVDAKIYGPEAMLGQLLASALKMQPSEKQPISIRRGIHVRKALSRVISLICLSLAEDFGAESHAIAHPTEAPRQEIFQHMRLVIGASLAILDEKNHVMNTAMDALNKQLKRCDSSLPYINDEISEEARLGSMAHWAYTDKTSEKKGIIAGERSRRAVNNVAAQEPEGPAIRSELRREAVAARKGRHQQVDSDFDDPRTSGRKGLVGAKGRKITDVNQSNIVGLGISNSGPPPSKRRKTEKTSLGSLPMERAISSVYGSNQGSIKGNTKEAPAATLKKKVPPLANGPNRRRFVEIEALDFHLADMHICRGNPNATGMDSPAAPSPIMGSFAATTKDRQNRSPAPATMQRVPSSRARQNTSQAAVQMSRNRSSSTNQIQKASNGAGGGLHGTNADVEKVSGLTGRSVVDVKNNMKEAVNAKGEHLIEDVNGGDGAGDMRGGLVVNSKTGNDRVSKREEAEPTNGARTRAERPSSISVRGGGSKAPSTNPTPSVATFAESQQKTRAPARATDPTIKRSHKKGAGLAAQLAAAEAAKEDEGSSLQGDDDDDEGENEPRYCYCNGVSYGEMVGCDADDCSREWFHLSCVGLTKAPAKNGKSIPTSYLGCEVADVYFVQPSGIATNVKRN